jgi:hypothetical protein
MSTSEQTPSAEGQELSRDQIIAQEAAKVAAFLRERSADFHLQAAARLVRQR